MHKMCMSKQYLMAMNRLSGDQAGI